MSRPIPPAAPSAAAPPAAGSAPTTSADVRTHLVDTLRRDLVGPRPDGDAALQAEVLPVSPSSWYLTGYLKPRRQPDRVETNPAAMEGELGANQGGADGGDDGQDDVVATARTFRPSSIGISALLPSGTPSIEVRATWGDYAALDLPVAGAPGTDVEADGDPASRREPAAAAPPTSDVPRQDAPGQGTLNARRWRRTPRAVSRDVPLNPDATLTPHDLPGSGGLHLAVICRPVRLTIDEAPRDLLAVQVFLVNDRPLSPVATLADEMYAFQAGLELRCAPGFVARPDLRGAAGGDWDQQVNDLHFAGVGELAVGHNVAAEWEDADPCRRVCTAWMPKTMVPRVEPVKGIAGERRMEELGKLPDFAAARAALDPLTRDYRAWIAAQRPGLAELTPGRRAVAARLLDHAGTAADRIEAGIAALADPNVLDAFRLANRAVAKAAMRRDPGRTPEWYPFQLAFILLGLPGLADPRHPDRDSVDLLFFPTGGGKTEAYLGLAAFAIGLRRRRNPGLTGAGLAVLMRYTLRLLTLDQLGRAAAVVCAMELERQADPARWGEWPIEIGLWVGQGATPNRMGRKGEPDPKRRTVRMKVLDYKNGKTAPIPIKTCPWCGSPFTENSFDLRPDWDVPRELVIACTDRTRACDFHTSKSRPLPIQAVDEPIYRRLPAFMIATVDKFAGMPWTGEIAGFFGGADRHVPGEGFLGAANPGRGARLPAPLKPPELVIQDELHLISGPLGTMAGLYEAALDRLCLQHGARPKIVASTATVRRAEKQIRALFDRERVHVFPPPGPDRGDSFFARSRAKGDPSGRLYVGIAAPGGSPKVNFLRGAVTLMAAAEHQWALHKGASPNPADPYMTLLCYFNALRELGSARNMVEGEIQSRLAKYGGHKRVEEADAGLRSRQIDFDCPELTSRVSTDRVSDTKERLAFPHERKGRVDAALATNMISVGLDITRLGLMLVSGQPKTVSEYIQATSRVGRLDDRPGLVIVLLNTNKPRDRSHYEGFRTWHDAFYRGVEAVSVTPFSARALDRGLAPVVVALARLGDPALTGDPAAGLLGTRRAAADALAGSVAARAGRGDGLASAEADALAAAVGARASGLLDAWQGAAARVEAAAASLVYAGQGVRLLQEATPGAVDGVEADLRQFRAPRSLRDVEASVRVAVLSPSGQELT